ncbi:uncharacterized protein BCR38DRAFT_429802 [Pseudomassariella vexata]|uniref:C3H1-type domain-containing protein n=1 Tax=Pseudomassariella vexata TaxID=1141098 RepID=A0A1Y2E406_9PEZI|nr:uncharacterized protein BCR38DRAFT_429802 [Pseudomassariella vexata]ORY66290.1 hypothetical protein BCR38DRAFT_429802 [Pseudomassariella vexata]
MSTQEELDLMNRISSLAGRINRHKAQQNDPSSGFVNHPPPSSNYRGSFRSAPYPRGGYRGSGRGRAPVYRNKTLVLNGQSQTSPTDTSEANSPSWVSKTDRHLQLINSAVFEKESQNRTQAIEQSLRQKRLQKDRTEKTHFANYLRHNANTASSSSSSNTNYEVTVDGIRFQVTKQGSKLIRAPNNPASTTPRVATIGGVKFHRTKNGNLVRHGIARAQRLAGGIKKVDVPCKTFSWTGSCPKGPLCRYTHDPTKVAICRDWLVKDACQNGEACDLAHNAAEERTPLCLHFAKGRCNNASCPYVHAEHLQTDLVCGAFGAYGYCEKGSQCPDRHVFECPDFSNTGVCTTKGCKLLHRERASVLRKAADHAMDDVSSDDDDTGGSEDIDSDEVEEFIGTDDVEDMDFSTQMDYIGF